MLAHSSALRWGRHSEPGTVYLITTVTQGRSAVFANFELARLVIAELRACDERGTCQTLAFVLMPEHLHWLVQLQGGDLSALVGYFKAHAAKVVNRRRGVTGVPLWQHGFHDQALRREEDLAAMVRYVVRNPERAGLVKKTGDYPHWDAIWLS